MSKHLTRSLPFVAQRVSQAKNAAAISRLFYSPSVSFSCHTPSSSASPTSCHSSSSAAAGATPAASFTLSPSIQQTECGLYVDRSLPHSFDKILIANRGEIACRIIRTCRAIGVKTVAIYSDADANAKFVEMADEAYRVGEAPVSQSYLQAERILEIAKKSGAQAIHPGYGFLSENAIFAKQCENAGVVFIGPPVGAIEAMGSKSASKIIMTNAGVPVVPGYHGDDQRPEYLQQKANECGYPIMLKAVLGGGGKGMRIVWKEEEFAENLEACKREALKSFGDERVLLERYIVRPRHIEFQVFADKHGNCVHLYERDCSVQRRHQKVLEEAPAPGMSEELRKAMGEAAVNAAKAVGYVGAGTVEFIFDADADDEKVGSKQFARMTVDGDGRFVLPDGLVTHNCDLKKEKKKEKKKKEQFFFMEMNTRLQVEHPVSEMIMRKDLVQWQLHVAANHELPVKQCALKNHGYAIEARIYAENPNNNFLPATGKLLHLSTPQPSSSVRIESGVRANDEVSIFYDPMISKLCCWGPSRQQALKVLSTALAKYHIVGPPTNIPFLTRAVNHPEFQAGQVDTGFIKKNIKDLLPLESDDHVCVNNVSFLVLYLLNQEQIKAAAVSSPASVWATPVPQRINASTVRKFEFFKSIYVNNEGEQKDVKFAVEVTYVGKNKYSIKFPNGQSVAVDGKATVDASTFYGTVGARAYHASVVQNGAELHVFIDGGYAKYKLPILSFEKSSGSHGGCIAPMAGKVVKTNVEAGQAVKKGQALVIMEAMKMEHVIRAPHDGIVESVPFAAGDFVEGGKTVVTFQSKPAKK